jgi:hypothetical protein
MKERSGILNYMKQDKTIGILLLIYTGVSFFIFTTFGKVGTLFMVPSISTQAYLDQWPSFTIGNLIIQQPSSSIIILILAILTIALGIHYFTSKKSRFAFWLGINFIFWGLGAFLAGLSYQAFGYYLKCTGLTHCLFTDWVELLYMTVTVISINAILMAYASLMKSYKLALLLKKIALISVATYTIFQGIGMLIPVQFMLSYEGMLLFLSPNLIIFIVLSIQNRKEALHKQMLTLWIVFIFINLAYFVALFGGQGSFIYNTTGIWFNENDTLHVLLIFWMIAWWVMIPPILHKEKLI